MVWHLEFRSELEISDYFNDSGKTSPNDRQILDGGKIASLLLADFMEFRFILRICPRYTASLGHYWIAALGSQSKWPNSGGEMIELWSIWVAICLLRFWLSKKRKKAIVSSFPTDSFRTSPALCGFIVTMFGSLFFFTLWKFHFRSPRTYFWDIKTKKCLPEQKEFCLWQISAEIKDILNQF